MRIVRFSIRGKIKYGILEDELIRSISGNPFRYFEGSRRLVELQGDVYPVSKVKLLAPCLPSKIVGLGLNYPSHAEETRLPIPTVPLIFLKPSTAVIGPFEPIVLPRHSRRVDYEGELAVVIGRRAKNVLQAEARHYILGYTCINDVSERYAQKENGQWTRAKGFDTFAPLGPWIETDVAPEKLRLETYVNGELRQSASTADLIFGVDELVSFISGVMTLLPGDVIATGTPAGIGPLRPGDIVEVKIDQIGTLTNPVVMEQ